MNRPARRAARRGDRQCRAVLDGVYWTKPQAGFSGGGVGISDSSRTADPRAAGGGAAAPAASLVSIKSARPRRLPRLAAHWADRPARAPLRRLAAPCSGLDCLEGDGDRAADNERGRHVGGCRRDWVGDSNPLTPIIDFTAQFGHEKGPRERPSLSKPRRAHLRMGGAQPHNFRFQCRQPDVIRCLIGQDR